MKNQRHFLKCGICGNVVGVIDQMGAGVICCGQEMQILVPNTVDASQEKHLPVAKREGGQLIVDIGSAAHPMTEEHHISWIAAAKGPLTERLTLEKTGQPSASFVMAGNDITIYAYCNLHGLWAVDI
jgi:superoxide reductase